MVGRHLALSWVEAELLEQTGDDQEHPVLGQNLQIFSFVETVLNFATQQTNSCQI